MSWEGIRAKLERVDELAEEIKQLAAVTLSPAEPLRIDSPSPNDEAALRERISRIVVPLRLGVLTSEGLHHLRSSLDHLICDLIRADGGAPNHHSQFPILKAEPASKRQTKSLDGRLKGIARQDVLEAIKNWQPYKKVHPQGSRTTPFLVLQTLNNFDKHNSLHLHTAVMSRQLVGKASTGLFNLVVTMEDLGDDEPMDRELRPFGTDIPANITKTRRIVAEIVVDDLDGHLHPPAQLLQHLRWRVDEIVRDLGRFLD